MYNTKESPDPRLNLWAMLAYYVRFCRTQHGQSGDTVAKLLKCARSSVSRLESGDSQLKEVEAEILDAHWNTGGLFSLLLWYARLGHDPNWAKNLIDFEKRARVIRVYDGQLIPMLLQTEDYARALIMAGRADDPAKTLADRMKRQDIMKGPDAPELWILIAETALAPYVGGEEVMRAQLAHLLELSHDPKIVLRVVPNSVGANEGLDGPFKILTVKEGDVGFTEATLEGRLVSAGPDVDKLRRKFEHLGARADSVDSSRRLITDLMERMR